MDHSPKCSSRSSSPSKQVENCPDCDGQRFEQAWCKNCEIAIFKKNFHSWTSGCSKIDEFIKHTQLSASKSMDYLEWIDFDQFELVKNTNKRGAFSSIYSAMWLEGPRWVLDEEADVWTRSGPINVVLKRIDNSQNMSQEFVEQLYEYYKCLRNDYLADCFGMTKDPTSCYMFVMRYYENGDLYSYIEETMGALCWRDIVDILWSISMGLEVIHNNGRVHGHLHGGNILVENEMDSIDAKIADTGLHGPVDKQTSFNPIYGVIPFVAPEIFGGSVPTKESDIYSFGMIMWMLSADVRPYYDKPHDEQLIKEICSGLKPSVVNGTPTVFSELMMECLDANPLNRPAASRLCEHFGDWITAICDDPEPSDLSNQFDIAEEIKLTNFENSEGNIFPCHEHAIYSSRILPINSNSLYY